MFQSIHACRNLRAVGSPAVTCLAPVNRMLLARRSNPRAKPIAMRRQEPRHVEQGKILLIVPPRPCTARRPCSQRGCLARGVNPALPSPSGHRRLKEDHCFEAVGASNARLTVTSPLT